MATNSKAATSDHGTVGATTIAAAALEAFREHGYHGTTVRDISRKAGLTVAALYYHFANKNQILFFIMRRAMEDLIRDTQEAFEAAGSDPTDQLEAMVRAHVRYHAIRRTEAFVGNSELRSLDADGLREIVALRDSYEHMFKQVVRRGTRNGDFGPPHPDEAVRAILAMCTAVATWYQDDDKLSPQEVADRYAELALHLVDGSTERRNDNKAGAERRRKASKAAAGR